MKTHLNPTCPFCDIDKLKDKISLLEAVEPMTVVADRYAHRMAMVLECVLIAGNKPPQVGLD